ncbi:MAG: hypothetical protein KIY12_08825 [Thermoplasmata archaeon]|uniref:Uncharacterized protein n=1 Tax=Candidatus Sysuiplasma superficiale TaxID=2823368 RepID=A0A8J7YQT9_9ARCH|nr:hypothetical protein [Candidatus Sysuiplasma superficiale]
MPKSTAVAETTNETVPANWRAKLAELGYTLHEAEEFGGGVPRLDKNSLVGVPFVIVDIKRLESDKFGREYFFCHVVTEDGREGYFTDGGVGIPETLNQFIDKTGQLGGLVCRNGLSRSSYDADSESGRPAGVTYYIA